MTEVKDRREELEHITSPDDQQQFPIESSQPQYRQRPDQVRMWSFPAGIAFYIVLGWVIALFFDSSRDFVLRWWWAFAAVVLGLFVLAGYLHSRPAEKKRRKTRAGVVVWVVLPIAITAMILIGFVVPADYQLTVIRSVFLAVVCLLPGTLWWLFTSQRKHGLLYEWIGNLSHLGLLDPGEYEKRTDTDRRISAYFKRFGAVYGPVSIERRVRVLSPPVMNETLLDGGKDSPPDGDASIFTYNTSVPVILATVLITLGWLVILPPVVGSELGEGSDIFLDQWLLALQPQQDAVAFAFLGAYFYSIQLLFRRYVLTDLQPAAYVAVTVRVLMAVIGTWAVVTAFGDSFDQQRAMVFGFVVGVFPATALQLLEILIKRFISIVFVMPSLQPSFPLTHIEGMTVWHRSRLEEEDIENVTSLATADIPDLLLKTRYSADRVIDWVDQALLLTAFGEPDDNTKKRQTQLGNTSSQPASQYVELRQCGIRTATSFLAALEDGLCDDSGKSGGAASDPRRIKLIETSVRRLPNLRLVENWHQVKPMRTEVRRHQFAI